MATRKEFWLWNSRRVLSVNTVFIRRKLILQILCSFKAFMAQMSQKADTFLLSSSIRYPAWCVIDININIIVYVIASCISKSWFPLAWYWVCSIDRSLWQHLSDMIRVRWAPLIQTKAGVWLWQVIQSNTKSYKVSQTEVLLSYCHRLQVIGGNRAEKRSS